MPWDRRIQNAILQELFFGQGKGKGKSKGNGKGKQQAQQTQQGKGAGAGGGIQPGNLNGSECRVCGKEGHTKSQCYHQDKTCDNCGKKGHLKRVCNQTTQPQQQQQLNKQQQQAPTAAGLTCSPCNGNDAAVALKIPWTCRSCHAQCIDQKLQKCEKCHVKRMQPPKPTDPPNPKPLISKEIQEKLKRNGEGDEEGMEENGKAEEITKLEAFIQNAKAMGLGGSAEEAEAKLAKLKAQPDSLSTVLNDSMAVKDMQNEKVKIMKQHKIKKEQMEAKAEKATTAKTEHVEARKKALKAAQEQYDATLVAINNDYDMFEEAEEAVLKQTAIDIEAATKHFNEEIQKLDAFIQAKNQNQEEEETPAYTQQHQISPDDLDMDVITQHLDADPLFKGTGEEARGFAQSMFDLLNTLVAKKLEEKTAPKQEQADMEVEMTHRITGGRPRPIEKSQEPQEPAAKKAALELQQQEAMRLQQQQQQQQQQQMQQ